jgi:hypothetical protein
MKNLINNFILFAAFVLLLASCKPELTKLAVTKGDLNLTSYVSIGNSLTAGYQSNGLFYNGQQSSYVNVLANQFKLVEPNMTFKIPLVNASSVGCGAPNVTFSPAFDPVIFNNAGKTFTITITVPAPYSLQTVTNCSGSGLAPAPAAAYGDGQIIMGPNFDNQNGAQYIWGPLGLPIPAFPTIPTAPSIYDQSGPFNNMGVPGAKATDVNKKGFGGSKLVDINTTTFAVTQSNPFFSRFAKDQTNSSMLSDAMLLNPTFFTLFIGNNDVLLWASAGGPASSAFTPSITPTPEFGDSINSIVKTLLTSAKQGVVFNVPQITSAAFFNYNKPDTTKYIIDENSALRKMQTTDMLLLTVPQDSLQCALAGFGTMAYPIPKKYTLTGTQVTQVTNAITGYNDSLKAIATRNDLAFFDMNAFTMNNESGSTYNGMSLTGTFVTGGIFSLDGLHLTDRGYASLANELVKVINEKYHSTLPGIDLTKYNGVTFPK